MGIDELLRAHREEIVRLASEHGANAVRVFGSVARGEADEHSDVDLLVRLEPGTTLLKQAALERQLTALIGRHVDVVSERGLRDRVRENVLREAVPL